MKLFELVAELVLDTDEFVKDTEKAEELMEEIAGSVSSIATTATTALAVGLASMAGSVIGEMKNIATTAIETAAEFQAQDAQFAAAFGDIADSAEAAFDSIGDDTNILSRRLKLVGTKAFSQFKGAGMEAVEALESMESYTRLAADGAAYYDMTLEEVDERLRSFLRGNTEAGDAIGLFTSDLQRNNKSLELYGEKWKNLNEAQRQHVMLDIADEIYEQAGALGQAAREGNSYANLLANMEASRQGILAKIGEPILEALTPLMQDFNEWLESNPELLDSLSSTISAVITEVLNGLKSMFAWVVENEDVILGFVQAITGLFGVTKAKTSGEIAFDSLEGYSEDAYELLTNLIEANNQLKINKVGTEDDIDAAFDALLSNAEALSLYSAYGNWQKENAMLFQDLAEGEMPYLPTELYVAEGTQELLQDQLDRLELSVSVNITPYMGAGFTRALSSVSERLLNFGTAGTDGSHDTGLAYVPYDGYVAELHQGERVLTELQNAQYSTQEKEPDNETDVYSAELVAAFREAIGGMTVQMDGKTVGTVVAPTVFREMGRQLGSKRFAT